MRFRWGNNEKRAAMKGHEWAWWVMMGLIILSIELNVMTVNIRRLREEKKAKILDMVRQELNKNISKVDEEIRNEQKGK